MTTPESIDGVRRDRRKFVTRNLLAIGAIAATALTSSTTADARCRRDPMMRRACHMNCFLRGTRILTVDGERNIEDLAAGDVLTTMFGGERRIEWVGKFDFERPDTDTPWPSYERPVRIERSAIAPGIPHADLCVTSWHAVYIDGMLVPAANLVNGKTIRFESVEDETKLEFFHIKLEKHDVIYAEGMPCESLLVDSEKAVISDDALHADVASFEASCAPLVYYRGRKGLIASRMRSAVSPWVDMRTKIDVIRDRIEARA